MQELVEWTNAALDARELHPLFIIGMFTVSILAIHPFQDGNGRLHTFAASVRVCLYALQFAESVIENSKESYYLALRQTQTSL